MKRTRKSRWLAFALALLLLMTAVPAGAEEGETPTEPSETEVVSEETTEALETPDASAVPETPDPSIPTPTPRPLTNREMSTPEYIFGGSYEDVNDYNHRVMASIAASGDIFGYISTQWPGTQGRRAPMWKDFSPTKPEYTPALGLFSNTTTDLVGQEWYYFGLQQRDLTFEDWQVTLVNGSKVWNCAYDRPIHRSPWISKEDFGLERIMISRMITPNAGYTVTLNMAGQRVMTTVAWRDADYSLKWDWREKDGINVLAMSWNALGQTLYMLFDADDGRVLTAVIAGINTSENDAYGSVLQTILQQRSQLEDTQ